MALRRQRYNAIHGTVDYTTALGPGYANIPTSMLTREMRELSRFDQRVRYPADSTPMSSEIIAPDSLKNHDIDLYYKMPDIYAQLQDGPDLVHTRIPQLGMYATLYRQEGGRDENGLVIMPPPNAENPELFTESTLPKWYGF